jgi:hypothetical protein
VEIKPIPQLGGPLINPEIAAKAGHIMEEVQEAVFHALADGDLRPLVAILGVEAAERLVDRILSDASPESPIE